MHKLFALALVALAVPALALASSQAMSPVVSSKLKGSNEVPAKGDPDGTGFVVVTFKAAKGQACWQFKGVAKVGAPSAAHIHKGRSGFPPRAPLPGAVASHHHAWPPGGQSPPPAFYRAAQKLLHPR